MTPGIAVPRPSAATLALLAALIVAALCAAAPADAARHARVSISPWEKGVMGAVSGGRNVCREDRRVAIFRMRGGKPRPGEDKRVARSRTSRGSGPSVWYAQLDARGTLYAKALRTKRCASAISRTTSKAGFGGGEDNGVPAPTCSPYVSEGPTTYCKLNKVTMVCAGDSFSRGRGACTTQGSNLWVNGGPTPWGIGFSGDAQAGRLDWDHGPHTVSLQTYPWQQFGGTVTSYLRGSIPGPGSADFSVADAWGQQSEGGGADRGDHLYTPNAPGQGAGEFGGPLYLDFRSGDPNPNRNTVTIEGYLFLKP